MIGLFGSFEFTVISNRCGPSIPAIMCVVNDNVLCWPGSRVVEPTTGWKGQHPLSARTFTSPMRNVFAPMFANEKL